MTTTAAPGTAVDRSPVDPAGRILLAERLRAAVRGEVEFGSDFRAVYATDSSNYRQVPLGVVFPRDAADVSAAVAICAEAGAPVLGRGAGTGLAGQTVNVGVVLDFSRHMNAILEIDPERRIARVQPGVVLDDLRAACEPFGLTFGPDPATHAWCTLGGMIGNNSCGTHALYAGKTVDNVRRLRIVTAAGEDLWVGSYDDAEYAAAVAEGGTLARLLGGLRETGRRYAAAVTAAFPDIPRRVSGYNLDQVLPGRPLQLARLLVGSESTLALTVEAELHLSTSPRHRHLVVLGYPDIFTAADAVPGLVSFGLLGLEGMDDTLVSQSAGIGLNLEGIALLPPGGGWLLAEIGDDDPQVAERRTIEFIAGLPESVHVRRIEDPVGVRQVWGVREAGLAATALPKGLPPNHEGWEDAAVPPERLGTYLRRITALWDRFGYYGAWYGHFGQGCVHTRNPFDLHTLTGLATFREFLEAAADVVAELGGSISGEHGDGQARGELLARMFGPEVIEAFRTVKTLFDPTGILNPGKLVDPYPLDTNLRYGPSYRQVPWARDTSFALVRDGGSLQTAAERCVGVGRCRRDDTGVMCPSYRATRDERHSTRGRAKMLVEMFTGEVTATSWRNPDVHEALELCLSCKGCAVDCPTGVDMATYKAEFNSHYYARRIRPRVMYALGLLPWLSRLATRVPRTASGALRMGGVGPLLRRAAGVTTDRPVPVFARKPFRRTRTARHLRQPDSATVVLWPDTFTNAFDPALGEDTAAVLAVAGETVHIPAEWACCGRTLYDPGMLDLARHSLRRVLSILDPFLSRGIPVVVPEPSCLAAFRDELPALLPDDPRAAELARLARSLSEHLIISGGLERLATLSGDPDGGTGAPVVIHPHCHGRAAVGTGPDEKVLRALGYRPSTLDAGCCGLAGSFGYAAGTAVVSRTIATEHWLPRLADAVEKAVDGAGAAGAARAAGVEAILAMDGFSCITQLDQLDGRPHQTVAALIRRALDRVAG
jgi:FAD/FMN-containing dehydrogenase/Fe-S oxidoreductase